MVVIGLMADPGLPEKLVRGLVDQLPATLSDEVDAQVNWNVVVSGETLPLTTEGLIPLMDYAQQLKASRGWDYIVCITDLPRLHDKETLILELNASLSAALISLPALGGLRLRSRLRRTLVQAVKELIHGCGSGTTADSSHSGSSARPRGQKPTGGQPEPAPRRSRSVSEDGAYIYATVRGLPGRVALLAGMVRSNRPGRLVTSLSSAMAAAAATGAFGIFFASIWTMADALHPLRLAIITGAAITALTGWLILNNGLWADRTTAGGRERAVRDNTATVATVFLSVTIMYAVLYLVILTGSLAVIPNEYFQAQLGHPVSFHHYLNLSWLAASMGITAGALGSNFDSDEAVREATYSRREHQRRQLEFDPDHDHDHDQKS